MSAALAGSLAGALAALAAFLGFVTQPTPEQVTERQDKLMRTRLSREEALRRARRGLRLRQWICVGLPLAGALVFAAVALGLDVAGLVPAADPTPASPTPAG